MRLIATFFLSIIAGSSWGQTLPYGLEFPESINPTERRAEIFGLYPKLANPNSFSELRSYGNEISLFEQVHIAGLRDEILGICIELKTLEASARRLFSNGAMAQNDLDVLLIRIEAERMQCHTDYVSTSRYWAIVSAIEDYNASKFKELETLVANCTQREECRTT